MQPHTTRAGIPTERQKESFQLIRRLIDREYRFANNEQTREYFTRLTGLYKNLNYAEWQSDRYQQLLKQIADLEREAFTSPDMPAESAVAET